MSVLAPHVRSWATLRKGWRAAAWWDFIRALKVVFTGNRFVSQDAPDEDHLRAAWYVCPRCYAHPRDLLQAVIASGLTCAAVEAVLDLDSGWNQSLIGMLHTKVLDDCACGRAHWLTCGRDRPAAPLGPRPRWS